MLKHYDVNACLSYKLNIFNLNKNKLNILLCVSILTTYSNIDQTTKPIHTQEYTHLHKHKLNSSPFKITYRNCVIFVWVAS